MIPNRGKYLDCNPINQPPGTWRWGKNFVVNKKKAAFVTEPGTDLTATDFPFSIAKPIGSAVFPDGTYVQFADGINGGLDRIGQVSREGIYSDLIVDNALNFDSLSPIRSYEVDYNAFSQRIVGFTDRRNSFRVLNVDDIPFARNPDNSLVNPEDISDLEGFPKFILPLYTFVVNQIGGSIFSGAYSACFAYESNDGTRTSNSPPSKMIYITEDSTSVGYDKFDGCPPRTRTAKSITFTVTNVDTRYDKLVLIVVRKVGGVTEVAQIKKIDIAGTTASITYTGTETEIAVPVEQALVPRPLYTKVGCVAQLNSQLYLGDLEAEEDIEYQKYANNIVVHYNTKLVTVNNINESHKNVLPGGFAHGEVYALYIAFVLKNGSWSRAFHIPGRPVILSDTLYAPIAITAGLPTLTKSYQIEDTTNKWGATYVQEGDTIHTNNLAAQSNMGYWENQNERYPANFPHLEGFPDLSGTPVRHHVFPTIRTCRTRHYYTDPGYGRDKLDILGIDVANVVIPSEMTSKIEGWGIFYARRDYSSSITLGNDLLLFAHRGEGSENANLLWSAGGNWRTRSFSGNNTTGSAFTNFSPNINNYIRGHNFELLKDKPGLSPSSLFMDFEVKYKKDNLIAKYVDVGKSGGSVAKSGENSGQDPGMVVDLTDTQYCTATFPAARIIRSLTEFKYLPANVIDGNIRTMKTEDIIHMKFSGTSLIAPANGSTGDQIKQSEMHLNTVERTAGTFPTTQGYGGQFNNGGEESYLLTYRQVKTDVYDEFNNQILTLTDNLCLPTETYKKDIRGGDTFTSIRSFLCTAPRWVDDFEKKNGITIIRAHVAESRYNIGLRHEVVGEVTTKYYPKTPPNEFWVDSAIPDNVNSDMIFDRSTDPNQVALNPDYSATNNYIQLGTYTTNQRLTNKFPYRVIRGGITSGTATSINGWKTFLAADYYESNRNRGKITDLFVLDDNLFIHHMYGLFRTLGTEKLSLGSTEVYLGTADIFAQRPKELISSELGYLGSQNIFAGVTFEGGRFWVDQSRGKCFLLSKNGAAEISKDGMYEFFRDNLKIDNSDLTNPNDPLEPNYPYHDNPIERQGIIATYDPKYERIILTKKSNASPFTLSYSVDKEHNYWAFGHDYVPDYLFCTSDAMYGYKNNRIHKFNSPTRVARYFEGDVSRSEVEIIFNEENHRNKEFYNFNWISEVFNNQSQTLLKDKTLTHIRVQTSYQDSGEIALIPFTTFSARYTTRRFKNTWNFNKVKDANSDVFKRKSMVDNYVSVTFIFNNLPNLDNTQNSLYLYLLNAKALLAEL